MVLSLWAFTRRSTASCIMRRVSSIQREGGLRTPLGHRLGLGSGEAAAQGPAGASSQ